MQSSSSHSLFGPYRAPQPGDYVALALTDNSIRYGTVWQIADDRVRVWGEYGVLYCVDRKLAIALPAREARP